MTPEKILSVARDAGFTSESMNFEWLMCIGKFVELLLAEEREACAKLAETPVGTYHVVVACGSDPAPYAIPRYLDWQSIATAIRARGQQ